MPIDDVTSGDLLTVAVTTLVSGGALVQTDAGVLGMLLGAETAVGDRVFVRVGTVDVENRRFSCRLADS